MTTTLAGVTDGSAGSSKRNLQRCMPGEAVSTTRPGRFNDALNDAAQLGSTTRQSDPRADPSTDAQRPGDGIASRRPRRQAASGRPAALAPPQASRRPRRASVRRVRQPSRTALHRPRPAHVARNRRSPSAVPGEDASIEPVRDVASGRGPLEGPLRRTVSTTRSTTRAAPCVGSTTPHRRRPPPSVRRRLRACELTDAATTA